MFELILSGTVILSVSIAAGFYYVQDLFAQHLIHKTVLTVIAWIVYAILTVGHIRHGWRVQHGRDALRQWLCVTHRLVSTVQNSFLNSY